MYLRTCAPSKDSGQPADSCSLIQIFSECTLNSQGCKVSTCAQQILWSDCASAQSDLSLCWAHMSAGTVSHVAAHSYWDTFWIIVFTPEFRVIYLFRETQCNILFYFCLIYTVLWKIFPILQMSLTQVKDLLTNATSVGSDKPGDQCFWFLQWSRTSYMDYDLRVISNLAVLRICQIFP